MEEVAGEQDDCMVTCTGLYADIEHTANHLNYNEKSKGMKLLLSVFELYNSHKDSFAKNIAFDPASESLSK